MSGTKHYIGEINKAYKQKQRLSEIEVSKKQRLQLDDIYNYLVDRYLNMLSFFKRRKSATLMDDVQLMDFLFKSPLVDNQINLTNGFISVRLFSPVNTLFVNEMNKTGRSYSIEERHVFFKSEEL